MNYLITSITFILLFSSCRTSNYHIHEIPEITFEKKEITKPYNIVTYIAGWSSIPISKFEAKKITHINYAFANLDSKGKIYFVSPNDSLKIDTLLQFKNSNPNLKVLVSVGGWSWSKNFSDVAACSDLRKKFANNATYFIQKYSLDGIDIDWEYPCMKGAGNPYRKEDKENFTLLLSDLRNALNEQSLHLKRKEPYVLTIATGASSNYLNNIEPEKVLKYIDFVNLMTYDFYSRDNQETGHHANLWSSISNWYNGICIDNTIRNYTNAGIPANRIVMGVPFYGRKWEGVARKNNGLYQKAQTGGIPISYRKIRNLFTSETSFSIFWDDSAQAHYLWSEKKGIFISFDTPQSLRYKVNFMIKNKLGGIMIWEYNSDYDNELLNSIISYIEDEKYKQQKISSTIFSSLYNIIHSKIINHLYSHENEHEKSSFAIPLVLFGFDNISIKIFAPFISSLWLSQFLYNNSSLSMSLNTQ